MSRIAILGAGVMGETLLAGLIRAGWDPSSITISDRRGSRRTELADKYGVRATENVEAVEDADTVLLVVKPQDVSGLLPEIRDHLAPGALVVSLCAGITTSRVEAGLGEGRPVVRVMPNTPAQVDEGMAAISGGTSATAEHLETVSEMMNAVGRSVVVPEGYQDAVTAISGSGPAYLFFVVEAMIDAGVMLGLPRHTATELVVQTMYGSAKLLSESGEHPTVLRERVTSPGGTTAAALRALEQHRVKAAFMSAMEDARNQSAKLAESNNS